MIRENHINREINSSISQFSYTDVMNNMNILEVVTPTSIYHGFSTRKMFWEEKFILVNMKNCCCHNVRKHREIKKGKQYITFDLSLNFGNLDKMKITSS